MLDKLISASGSIEAEHSAVIYILYIIYSNKHNMNNKLQVFKIH